MSMVMGRVCERCQFDQSMITFRPLPADYEEPRGVEYCIGCGAVYNEQGEEVREATDRFRQERPELREGPGHVLGIE